MSFDLTNFRTDDSFDFTEKVEPLPTGSFVFDYVTGIGGLPRGRVIECFGPESSGKSTAMYQAIAQAQALGGVGLVLDYENSFTARYASQLGLDLDPSCLLVQPAPLSLSDGFRLAGRVTEAAAKADVPCVVVFDSVAAMPLESETEGEGEAANNMLGAWRAKALNNALREWSGRIASARAVWGFINHELDEIVTDFYAPGARARAGQKRTPGGRGLKYFAAQRFQFTPGKKLKGVVTDPVTGEQGEGYVATMTRITCVKNKLAPPHRSHDVLIRYGAGIDNAYSIFSVGVARGLIARPTKQKYEFPDGASITGANAAVDYIQCNPEVARSLEGTIRTAIETAWQEEQESRMRQAAHAVGQAEAEEEN